MTRDQRCIANAGHMLDAVKPGWEHAIDYGLLDLAHREHCVLGQVFGSYNIGRRELGYGEELFGHAAQRMAEEVGGAFCWNERFRNLWIEAIADRRMEPVPELVREEAFVFA